MHSFMSHFESYRVLRSFQNKVNVKINVLWVSNCVLEQCWIVIFGRAGAMGGVGWGGGGGGCFIVLKNAVTAVFKQYGDSQKVQKCA